MLHYATSISLLTFFLAGPEAPSAGTSPPPPTVAAVSGETGEETASRGRALLEEGKPLQAVVELERAVASRSASVEVLRALASAYAFLEDPAAAKAYERLLLASPGDVRALLGLAQFHWRAGRTEEGNRILESLLAQPPPKPNLGLEYARALMSQSRFVQAEREFGRACGALACDAETLALWADALLENGRFEEAAARYREAVAKGPELVAPRHRLGRLLLLVGDAASARAELEAAASLAPGDAAVTLDLGRAREAAGDALRAEASYRASLKLDPDLSRAHHALGTLLARLGRGEEARAEIALYAKQFESDQKRRLVERTRTAEINLGWTRLREKRPKEALAQFERHPRDVEALRGAARALSELGRRREALEAWERAIALAPEDLRLRYERDRELSRGRIAEKSR